MNTYIGHTIQLSGVQVCRLEGGKAAGMRMLRVRNGKGLDFEISLDRCADIVQLLVDGVNMSYITPAGYVHPSYYDKCGLGFLKSFTAGFCTTCGFNNVGNPCTDDGEEFGLHGTISNTPCESYSFEETDDAIIIRAQVRDASLFSHQLLLTRTYTVSKTSNNVILSDEIKNIGNQKSPVMLLYHCNMGYPLLSENAIVAIPHSGLTARNAHAQEDIENALNMEEPQKGYEERCYYYNVKAQKGIAKCGIFNPDINKGLIMSFDKDTLDYFTEWKMMGECEYVLGLEPGNCSPEGREFHHREGTLKFVESGEIYSTHIQFEFTDSKEYFEANMSI